MLASGAGSNLGALLAYFAAQSEPAAKIALVVSDRAAGALARATVAGVATATLADPADAARLTGLLDEHRVDLIVLAGYLKLVPETVVARFRGAIVNVHPALLPRHGGPGMYGRHVHRAAIDAGDARSGATVHFVDAAYDRGAPLAWAEVDVAPGDSPDSLAARVLVAEHFVLPRAVDGVARGAIRLAADAVELSPDAARLFTPPPPGVIVRLAGGS